MVSKGSVWYSLAFYGRYSIVLYGTFGSIWYSVVLYGNSWHFIIL